VAGLRGHFSESSFLSVNSNFVKMQGKHKVPCTASRQHHELNLLKIARTVWVISITEHGWRWLVWKWLFFHVSYFLTQMIEMRSGNHVLTISYFLSELSSCQHFLSYSLPWPHTLPNSTILL
jgi:hypothetical protein